MGEGFQFLDIILFAMIAGFLVLRLRGVLGRRTGNDRRPPDRAARQGQEPAGNDNVFELPDRTGDAETDDDLEADEATAEDPLAQALGAIGRADSNFDPPDFVTGAQAAFEMVVQAFAEGDTKTLRSLLNDEVYENFTEAIRQRKEAEETLETMLIGVKSGEILEARMEGRIAFVTVKFVTEQVNVTRDEDGEVVDGDPNRAMDITDIWTFARNTRARDPNWTLVETRSQN